MASLKVAVVPVTAFQQNCTILWDSASMRGAVIDPGGDAERIARAIAERGVRVEQILLTHGHLDHAGGAAELREILTAGQDASALPIIGPDERDAFLLANIEQQAAIYGLAGLRDVTPDRWLSEGDTVDIGPHRFEVLHCPGHTPGHVVFFCPAVRLAQVGDVLFQGSVGRTDFPYGDHATLMRSIREKLLPLGDDVSFICGHGPGSTLGAERRENPFLRG
ncbi:MAG TPA: MBL fold metallo-hydrolase [Acetobacteraceae bacterium]|nr:MBL fold metallo-hydrolase [Acetobacteraceae bacterium]